MEYTKSRNTYFAVPQDDPRDRINIEVGDSKQTAFYPQVKVARWDNEQNFSFRLVHDEAAPTVSRVGETIRWSGVKVAAHNYAIPVSEEHPEGGYEFEVILKEKPATNKVEFTINTKGVDFFYQGELTKEEIDEGATREDRVVGSYAVYASEEKINYAGGKLYKSGKIAHIYRPRIVDAKGVEVLGDLNIDTDAGLLTVTIPQEFIDTAAYPVRHAAGLTVGFTTVGASASAFGPNNLRTYQSVTMPSAARATSVVIYAGMQTTGTGYVRPVIYKNSDLSRITWGAESTFTTPIGSGEWKTFNVTSADLTSSVDYNIGCWQNTSTDFIRLNFDSGTAYNLIRDNTAYHATNDPPATYTTASTSSGTRVSVYLVYAYVSSGSPDVLVGSGHWVCPAGVTSVNAAVRAPGGGGGGAGNYPYPPGTGGGGGAYSLKNSIAVTPGSLYAFDSGTVGAGGTLNISGSNATDAYFVDTSTVMAKGGTGGGHGGAPTPGTGGAAGSGVGDTKYSGGDGGAADDPSDDGGGGGGGAGDAGNGGNASGYTGGTGGTSGGGAGGTGANHPNNNTVGTSPGGGGGGGNDATSATGRAGAAGEVRITYTVPGAFPPSRFIYQAVNRASTY